MGCTTINTMKTSITFLMLLLLLLLLPLVEPSFPDFAPTPSNVNVDTGGNLWHHGHVPFLVSLPRGHHPTTATRVDNQQHDDAVKARPNIPPASVPTLERSVDNPPPFDKESQTYEFSMILRDILHASNTRIEALQNEMAETNQRVRILHTRVHVLRKQMMSRFDALQDGGNLNLAALMMLILLFAVVHTLF